MDNKVKLALNSASYLTYHWVSTLSSSLKKKCLECVPCAIKH